VGDGWFANVRGQFSVLSEIMLEYQVPQLEPMIAQVAALLDAVMALVGVLVGLALWLLGGRFARPVCVLGGLIVGALGGATAVGYWSNATATLVSLLVGGTVGCLLAYLLFRVWMGVSFAVVFGAALAFSAIIWLSPSVIGGGMDKLTMPEITIETLMAGETRDFWQAFTAVIQELASWPQAIWQELKPAARSAMIGGGLVGGMCGLLIGLILPRLAASIQSAFVGSILMVSGGGSLFRLRGVPGLATLAEQPGVLLLLVGLITLMGTALQCMVFCRKTDK